MTSPQIVVTTMHGTFAPDATWVTESSPFCVALKKELNAEVQFETVRWSGANSIDERLSAAELLKTHLHEQLIRHPQADHFVIAHSHAGNTALYALKDKTLQERIAGVVCLATPFVTTLERKWPTHIKVSLWLFAFLAPVVLAVLLLFLAPVFWEQRQLV